MSEEVIQDSKKTPCEVCYERLAVYWEPVGEGVALHERILPQWRLAPAPVCTKP